MVIVNLLSTGPGTFVCHLLTFLALEVMAGIALIKWRHTRNPDRHRTLCAFGGLLALRALLLLGEPLGPAIIAPLANGLEAASLVLLGWAFLAPLLNHRTRKIYLVGGLGVMLLYVVAFMLGWYRSLARVPNRPYVTFWQQVFWYAVNMLLTLVPALIPLRLQRRERQWLPTSGFAILFLGFTTLCIGSLLLTVSWFESGESDMFAYTLIGVGRLINMLGYPLFAIALHRTALQDLGAYRHELQDASGEALRQTQELLFLLETSRTVGESLDLGTILRRVAESTTMALDADRCALFLVNPDQPGTISLAAQHARLQHTERQITQLSLPLTEQPTLDYALKRRKQLTINAGTNDPRLQTLYRLLGSQKAGPTIVQPLLRQRRILGALVVGNDRSQRTFAANEGRLCRSIAVQIAAAIENARLYRGLEAQAGQLAESLQSQEDEGRRRAAILESITEGVIVSDEEGHIITVNAAAEHIVGIPRQRILGRSIERLMSRIPLGPQADRSTVAQSDTPLEMAFELESKVLYINAAPVLTPAGNHLGVVAILRDITGETEAERAKCEFIAAISHELLTPITAIRGYAEALGSGMIGAVSQSQSQLLRVIRDNALRMVSLTENLLAVSQIEKGFLKLEYGETDLHLLAEDIVRSFQNQLEAHQLEVSLELDDDLPIIEADPARVRQILDNLISNAIKFTYPGGHITIGARTLSDGEKQSPKHCSVWVSDTGIGISSEEQPRIWKRFYRPTSLMAAEASGLGVGLSIVKSLVEAHSGRVWVKSTPGVGSTFTVLLPTKHAQPISD